jgi:asparagine synthase (glutamine-hydrolysing)
MCGIIAVVDPEGGISERVVHAGAQSLRHRGPDCQRVWLAPHRRAGLGHARLSIIDLETGDQPIASEDERLQLVVNGEFYDFERLRGELERAGHVFRTRSDSEIALHLYEDRGAPSLHQLRGEFAFALWNDRDGQLFAARDRFGIKPLYWAMHEGVFLLASEIKALAALGVPLRWDPEVLFDQHHQIHPPHRTPFAGVHQVPPGHYLVTSGRDVRMLPYWDFDFPPADAIPPRDAGACAEELASELDEAIRLRLRADVPVACYLSGGIDSCAVLGMASRMASQPIRAYTIAFDHADYDERALAEEQARLSGAEFLAVPVRADELADHFCEALYHAERIVVNGHVIAKYLLSRAVRDSGIRVVLTGEGADETFGGYPHFRRDVALYNRDSQSAAAAADLVRELDAANRVSQGILLPQNADGTLPSVRSRVGFVPSTFEIWAQAGKALRGVLQADFVAAYRDRDPFAVMLDHLDLERQLAGRDPLNRSLYLWAKTLLPNYILSNLGDRMEMAHSVEGRLPFLDHHVVEAVARMPVGAKIRGMTEKFVLREAARPVLTDVVYRRQKHPFLSPPATLQPNGGMWTLVQDTLRGPSVDGPGIYDRSAIARLLDAVPSMDVATRTRLDPVLMTITSICVLHERFVAGAVVP